jgi:hypothetical protein
MTSATRFVHCSSLNPITAALCSYDKESAANAPQLPRQDWDDTGSRARALLDNVNMSIWEVSTATRDILSVVIRCNLYEVRLAA